MSHARPDLAGTSAVDGDGTMQDVIEPRALYSKFDRFLYAAVALAFGVASIAAVVSAFDAGATNASGRVAFGGVGAVFSAIFARISMLRLVLHDEYLLVVNPLRTYRVPWSEIQNIDAAIFYGWKVRIWVNGKPRPAFGLCQFSKYTTSHGPKYDDINRDAPRWLSRGYSELREYWMSKK